MISLPIISIIFCFAYIIFILLKYGVPVSLSETYYILPVKWDWLFSAWTVLTAAPFSIYWFNVAPAKLKWIPVVVAIAVMMIGVADCYKSGPKRLYGDNYTGYLMSGDKSPVIRNGDAWKNFWKDLIYKFSPKEFFKYGWAHFIHYVNSLIAIILSTIYICITAGAPAIACTILSYVIFIIIGMKIDGVYNEDYSADVDNKTWIFFMEVVCFINLFVFIW